MVKSSLRGHEIVSINGKEWHYVDTGEPIWSGSTLNVRPCKRCGKLFDGNKPDPCLGTLPGVKNACCGHGDKEQSYIAFENGVVVRGFNGMEGAVTNV